ncbi:thiol reductant ABC exporter subunit CydD [Arthrobacter bambusae]|uniref:thiol reductant ABC exporter subunit CydD n=1 Tax=Arthrobacter bambusae TaxID=1338426 RepID=UPI0027810EBF|nr:thiol reductant ABC exporter subunit CydD [Arthrobacter bambusae]MDQ0028874.1 ATP-binding cassette subfamily C protein CydCD [Arthrobacter bambusae]MDQ0096332.1 ATP-binding cassette subfamily C protein CydCD [Arthrobacter bambusae]
MKPQLPAGPATRSALYLLGLLSALKALSLVLIAQAIAEMLSGLAAGGMGWREGLLWGAAGAVLRSLTVWGQGVAARRAALGVKEELRSALLRRALGPGAAGRVGDMNDGGLAVLATRGLDALDNYYTQFLPALVNCAAVPLLLGARILFADWVSAVVVVLTLPLVPLFMVLIGRHTEDQVHEAQSTLRRLSGHILELAKGLPVLVGLGRAGEQRAALEDLSEEYRSRTMGTLRTAFLSALALELIATISVAVVAVFIGVRLVAGDMGLEAGLLALILAPDCYLPLRELGTAHHASDDGREALATANAVLESPAGRPLDEVSSNDVSGADVLSGADEFGTVGVTGLTVRYAGRAAAAVGPIDFKAPRGRITALDGRSGSGKSTILGVLAGTIGDGPLATIEGSVTGTGAGTVAWVPQHPVMVADTALDEVLLYLNGGKDIAPIEPGATPDADMSRAMRCLEQAAAEHLASKHPSELSPGEMRRVAVARGLARLNAGATVLLLDEPTAHLDAASADAIRSAIAGLRGAATVIMVAHDAATRKLADNVVKVDGGTAQEQAGPARLESAASMAVPVQRDMNPGATPDGGIEPPIPLSTLKALGRILAPVRYKFALAVLIAALAALFAVALSGLSGWLIIRASEQPPILYLLGAIVGVRFFGIGRAVLRYAERLVVHDTVFAAMTKLRGALWATLSARALSLRRLLQGGNVLGAVVDDVDTLRDVLPRVVLPPLSALAVAASAVAASAVLVPATVPAVVASAVVGLLAAPLLAVLADRNAARSEQQIRSLVLRDVAAALDARAELSANGVAGTVLASLTRKDSAATEAARRSAWADGIGQGLAVLACTLGALAAGILAAPSVQAGTAAPAVVAVVVLVQLALSEPYAAAVSAVRQGPALAAVLRRIAQSGAFDAPEADDGGVLRLPERPDGAAGLLLDRLEASWPGGEPVFSGVSAEASPGRWLAVTGPSGSGKSTLLSVLLGFLPASSGRAYVSGDAAWCPQEAHLFDSTIRGNLLLARPASRKPSEADMYKTLGAVGLSGLVSGLPGGLDSRTGPSGSFLSGGERQRLAMARTLLTGAAVLLLDEPTAHLDAAAAHLMMAELRVGLRDVTVVLVTHNPADIAGGDARLDLGSPSALPALVRGN